jgi:hypothetical protein
LPSTTIKIINTPKSDAQYEKLKAENDTTAKVHHCDLVY